jgi:hypothetical protein
VRAVDIVGTPLAVLNRVLVTGNRIDVFNGMCGAESGQIPVSAAAPAMLFSEIEVQKRVHALNRPDPGAAKRCLRKKSRPTTMTTRKTMTEKLRALAKLFVLVFLLRSLGMPRGLAQSKDWQASAQADPVLQAMRVELERSKTQLKLEYPPPLVSK